MPPLEMKIGAYSTTKHALAGYAKNLRNELAGERIGVTLLCPSGIAGNLAENSAKSHAQFTGTEDLDFGGKQPVGRELEGETVIGEVTIEAIKANLFLASNKKQEVLDALHEQDEQLFA
jgi:NAD(P)-dependent dehydrogenase (short-subunit alcohol dehydrogenase family)